MSNNEPGDFGLAPDSKWTVHGTINELPALLHRASEFLDTVAASHAVRNISLWRNDSGEAEIVVSFDHWLLPADLDYLIALHPGRGDDQVDDVDFVLDLAERLDARSAIDFGCGWGALAIALAGRGLSVTGIDPAKAMLEQALARDSAAVQWVQGDARAMEDPGPVDLVVMTGNIPSIYVTDEAWDELLSAIRAALRPGGHVAFGSWNPRRGPGSPGVARLEPSRLAKAASGSEVRLAEASNWRVGRSGSMHQACGATGPQRNSWVL